MPPKHTPTGTRTNQSVATTMQTENEKMLTGKAYLASDPQLVKARLRARALMQRYNGYPWPTNEADNPDPDYFGPDDRRALLAELFNLQLDDLKQKPLEIEPPFYCDYGTNITFKGPFYCNFNCHVLDCAPVVFGSRVICGPNVQIYAGTHSTEICERQKGLERAYPVTVGDDVWIGGGAILIGPCTIGNGTTIAAGAVVGGDVPANVVMAGVPARIIKHLNSNNNKSDHESNSDLKPGHPKSSTSNANQSNHSKSIAARSPGGGSKNLNPTSVATDDDQASGHSEETSDPFAECFLANIPSALSNGDLHNALSVFGEVRSLTMDRSRRLGFVRFGSAQAAEEAVEAGRGPDGLVVMMNQETNEKMVVGIERRRMSDTNRTFNPDLITSTRCLIRRLPNTVDFEELKRTIEEHAGSLVEWTVQDFTSPDPTKPSVDKFISLEFEQLCGAREAVRLSQNINGTLGGIDVPGTDGIKARIEARKQFSPQSAYRTSYRGHHQQPFHHNSGGGYHQTYPNHHQQHHPRSSRGSYGGYHSRGGSPNHNHHYLTTTTNPAPGTGGGPGNYQNNKAFNGSFTKYKPRRSVPGGMNGSE
ncbi:Maltose acetyltransferase [Puccinia graminis f. sp. tritici]|uniref:Maltose acetyltransferase n=1 Tax=Puccinia graminis f. sp. tritici TaxID=56615 RepID=A0A5B0MF12_PUCGR|nr:Maltose acetyltransferase [Puccinia graminis f. sp. tritici]